MSHISPSSLRPSQRRQRLPSLHQKLLLPQPGQADTKRNGFRSITCARPRAEKCGAQLAQGTSTAASAELKRVAQREDDVAIGSGSNLLLVDTIYTVRYCERDLFGHICGLVVG